MKSRIRYLIRSPVAVRRRVLLKDGDVSVAACAGLAGIWNQSVLDVRAVDRSAGVIRAEAGAKARHLLVRRGDDEVDAGWIRRQTFGRRNCRLDDVRNATAAERGSDSWE